MKRKITWSLLARSRQLPQRIAAGINRWARNWSRHQQHFFWIAGIVIGLTASFLVSLKASSLTSPWRPGSADRESIAIGIRPVPVTPSPDLSVLALRVQSDHQWLDSLARFDTLNFQQLLRTHPHLLTNIRFLDSLFHSSTNLTP